MIEVSAGLRGRSSPDQGRGAGDCGAVDSRWGHYRERMPVRVVLVDDHEMVIEGLKAMLAPFADRVEVVGEAVGAD